MVLAAGLSQEAQEFIEHHRVEDLLKSETVQFRPIPKLSTSGY